ncbi:MAG: hypothetical protein MJ068_00500 [Clostridia bacterium]|nr:hypothetical protein [Clostridia bacterium]
MSKEAIINKIISDAELKAAAMVGEAKAKAESTIADANAVCDAYRANSKKETDGLVMDIDSRAQTVAELDSKKVLLSAKAQIIDKVFERVLDKIKELDKDTYLKLLLGMLENAEDGDVITVSEREKKILTEKAVEDFAKKKGIKLTLSKTTGDFDGGMILSSNGIDKNLTFDVEVSLLREEIEMQIAKELFG